MLIKNTEITRVEMENIATLQAERENSPTENFPFGKVTR